MYVQASPTCCACFHPQAIYLRQAVPAASPLQYNGSCRAGVLCQLHLIAFTMAALASVHRAWQSELLAVT